MDTKNMRMTQHNPSNNYQPTDLVINLLLLIITYQLN